jgi:DNA repair protein RecN (Recombination protein N)
MPTLVFDEVDTGISGDASIRVGELLAEMAQSCQVICITHQPQIASKGTRHYFVYKQDNEKGILTAHIKMLSMEERIKHIAQMSGGEQAGQEAIEYAKALLR